MPYMQTMAVVFGYFVASTYAAPMSSLQPRADKIDQVIGTVGAGTYSVIFKVHSGILYNMAVSSSSSGHIYADTWPGWGWGPSETIPYEMAFVVSRVGLEQLVFTADEETGSPNLTYEIKKTDEPGVGVMRTGSVPT